MFGTSVSFLLLLQPNMRQEEFKAGRVEFTLEFRRISSIEAVMAWQKNREASRRLLSTVRKQGACRSRTRQANKLHDPPPVIYFFQPASTSSSFSNTVALARDQVLHVSLCGWKRHFTFKPHLAPVPHPQ